MRYYLGHWQWTTGNGMACYAPPAGVVGCLDLGTLPQMSVGCADRGRLLCWTQDDVALPSEYESLGVGDCRELNTDGAMLDKFQSLVGYRPQGAKLVDAVWDCLEGGADIDGATGPLPLVPTTRGNLELHFAGHSIVKRRRFKWGNDAASPKLKQLLRKEFRGLLQNAKAGKLKDAKHAFRVLDYWCDKYGVSDWREFVPANLQKDVPGRVKHETAITDNFNRADAGALGTSAEGWSWAENFQNAGIVSNRGHNTSNGGGPSASRAETDLSSADHYAQAAFVQAADITNYFSPVARFDPSAITFYQGGVYGDLSQFKIVKTVAAVDTVLGSGSVTLSLPEPIRVECNGSSIKSYQSGVERVAVTDTAITGFLRTGILTYRQSSSTDLLFDDFVAADLAAGPTGSPWNYYAQQG